MPSNSTDINLKIAPPKFTGSWELVKLTLKTFFKCFWFISIVTIPFYLPLEILKYHLIPNPDEHFRDSFRYERLVGVTFGNFLQLVVLYAVAHFLKTKTFPPIRSAFGFGIKKWAHLFGQHFIGGVFVLIGILFFIVPGIYLSIAYALILPVVCFEGSIKKNWLERSRELTFGYRDVMLISGFVLFLIIVPGNIIIGGIISGCVSLLGVYDFSDIFTDVLNDIFMNAYVILSLLLYLKLIKHRGKKPREVWFLKWAQ